MKELQKFVGAKTNDVIDEMVSIAEGQGFSLALTDLDDGFANIDVDPRRVNVGQRNEHVAKIWIG